MIAPDLRGHGHGLRSRRVFRLADCADDCAATLVELGTGPVIAVGYSMGGPVAQLLWRRHRDLVVGPRALRDLGRLHARAARSACRINRRCWRAVAAARASRPCRA